MRNGKHVRTFAGAATALALVLGVTVTAAPVNAAVPQNTSASASIAASPKVVKNITLKVPYKVFYMTSTNRAIVSGVKKKLKVSARYLSAKGPVQVKVNGKWTTVPYKYKARTKKLVYDEKLRRRYSLPIAVGKYSPILRESNTNSNTGRIDAISVDFNLGNKTVPPMPNDPDKIIQPAGMDFVKEVNNIRVANGIKPLTICTNLNSVAVNWAKFIAPQFSNGTPLTINGKTKNLADMWVEYRYMKPYQSTKRAEYIYLLAEGETRLASVIDLDGAVSLTKYDHIGVGYSPTPHGQTAVTILVAAGGTCNSQPAQL